MRIGLVLASTPPYSETFFRNKIRILTEYGFDVVLLVDHKNEPFEGCEVRAGFSGKSLSPFKYVVAIFRMLLNFSQTFRLFKSNKQDGFSLKQNATSLLISAHIFGQKLDWLHFGFATMAINRENTANAIGAKMAVSLRGTDLHTYPLQHPGCYALTWKRVSRLHHISNYLLKLAKNEGFDSNKTPTQLITPAIDTNIFCPPIERIKNEKPILITVARLHWIKGIEYILEALAYLKHSGVEFEYYIIGEGDDFNRLYFAAHQLKITPNVHFVGKKSHKEINLFLSSADLFIMYSLDEGFCNSVLEAQAMGCLTIVSNNEALMENVIDKETGWVAQGRNPRALANQIQEILAMSENETNLVRENAIKRVKNSYNLSIQHAAFVRFYEEIV